MRYCSSVGATFQKANNITNVISKKKKRTVIELSCIKERWVKRLKKDKKREYMKVAQTESPTQLYLE